MPTAHHAALTGDVTQRGKARRWLSMWKYSMVLDVENMWLMKEKKLGLMCVESEASL